MCKFLESAPKKMLPQGHKEIFCRVVNMVNQIEKGVFGHCNFTETCQGVCSEDISKPNIARLNYEYKKDRL